MMRFREGEIGVSKSDGGAVVVVGVSSYVVALPCGLEQKIFPIARRIRASKRVLFSSALTHLQNPAAQAEVQ